MYWLYTHLLLDVISNKLSWFVFQKYNVCPTVSDFMQKLVDFKRGDATWNHRNLNTYL